MEPSSTNWPTWHNGELVHSGEHMLVNSALMRIARVDAYEDHWTILLFSPDCLSYTVSGTYKQHPIKAVVK